MKLLFDYNWILIQFCFITEVVEHMCSITSLQMGEYVQNIAKDMDTYSQILPLGVTAGITPFNFPAMIPLWMFPVAITCGNTSIIKPSERDPGATMLLMEMLNEAGCPPGVVNVSILISSIKLTSECKIFLNLIILKTKIFKRDSSSSLSSI